MKQRLFKSFFLSAMAVFLICITVFAALLYVNMNDVTRQTLDVQAQLAAQTVETGGLAALEQLSLEDCRIRWLSPEGEVLYDSAPQLHTAATQQVPLADGSALEVSNVGYTLFQLLLQSFTPLLFVAALAAVLSALLATRAAKALTEPLNRIDFIHPDERDVDEELKPLVRRLAEQNRQILSQMEDLGREHDRQDRLRREFTANVSHELKTPLTSINGFAELIRDGLVRPEDVQRFAGKICDEARRLMDLVGDILRLSRLEERGRDLAMEPLSLREEARLVKEQLTGLALRRGVTVTLAGSEGQIVASKKIVAEILHNLTDNAIQYNRPGGSVTITVSESRDTATVAVQDTGIGIPKEELPRIFERFYRVDKSHSRELGGTGLGLSIVKHGAVCLGAQLRVESDLGVGTTITVQFPRAGKEQSP
ncbi:MAG TPA: ATP-binding protein [Candidatus Avoscillospira avicola]|uniref:histidine kinase n=1 Tax=Candidatus Avoscillospira avicola TaxID=2840706 RepID=A0A9D1DIA5_9FIRM|nr:ATP-binding protein [Candidatus Avoscillospira avicola]